MTNAAFPAGAKRQAAAVARSGATWIQWLARIGFAARSVVYTVVGLLAAKLALGDGGQATDHVGAMRSLLRQPLGEAVLVVLAVGFFGYALWRMVQAFVDPEHRGTSAKGIALRVSYAFRAAVYSVFGVQAVRMLVGDRVSGGGGEKEELTARAMAAPAGPWLVGAIGAGLLAYAIYQLYRAWKAKIDRHLELGGLSPRAERTVVGISRFGIAARGVVFGAAGVLFIRAALQHDPAEAGGVRDSLRLLLNQPNGVWILAAVSIGLIAYGVYQALEARYRHIETA
jgi:hypothetical protein